MSSEERAIEDLSTMPLDPADAAAARALAAAERAVAQRTATAAQAAGVEAVQDIRRPEDRLHAWRSATGS
jgi:hypothetical protein